jgi:hypothetical protein
VPLSAKQKIEMAERDRRVIELKSRGWTFDMIAKNGKIKGVSHAQQAKVCFDRGLANAVAVAANQYRFLENEKYDMVERTLVTILTGTRSEDRDRNQAAGNLIRLFERRARLNGIDAQVETDIGTAIKTVIIPGGILDKTIRADDH